MSSYDTNLKRFRHEKKNCSIYGGDVDKRKKVEFSQACELSKQIDGTLKHTAQYFNALMGLPQTDRVAMLSGNGNSLEARVEAGEMPIVTEVGEKRK